MNVMQSPVEAEAESLLAQQSGSSIRKLLLHGPPQSGKSHFAQCLIRQVPHVPACALNAATLNRDCGAQTIADVITQHVARLLSAAPATGEASEQPAAIGTPSSPWHAGCSGVLLIDGLEDLCPSLPHNRSGREESSLHVTRAIVRLSQGQGGTAHAHTPSSASPWVLLLATCSSLPMLHPAVVRAFHACAVPSSMLRVGPGGRTGWGAGVTWLTACLADVGLPVLEEGQEDTAVRSLQLACGPPLPYTPLLSGDVRSVVGEAGHGWGPADYRAVAQGLAAALAVIGSSRGGTHDTSPLHLTPLLRSLLLGHVPLYAGPGKVRASGGGHGGLGAGNTGGRDAPPAHLASLMHVLPGVISLVDHRPAHMRPQDARAARVERAAVWSAVTGGPLAYAGGSGEDLQAEAGGDEDATDDTTDYAATGATPYTLSALSFTPESGLPWSSVHGHRVAKEQVGKLLRAHFPACRGVVLAEHSTQQVTQEATLLATLRAQWPPRPGSAGSTSTSTSGGVGVGLLLYGPPGTGKTLLARAIAGATSARFLPLSIPHILRAGVGDSERALLSAFARAAAAAPCVLLLDELQALFTRQAGGGGGDEEARMSSMLTATLLSCMDEVSQRPALSLPPVLVVGATNVPWACEPALLAPHRLGKAVYVGLPDEGERKAMLEAMLASMPVLPHESLLPTLVQGTAGYSAADISAVGRVAAMLAVTQALQEGTPATAAPTPTLLPSHFLSALSRVAPSVSAAQVQELHAWGEARGGQGEE